jgi:arsenic resistance protein ArsH
MPYHQSCRYIKNPRSHYEGRMRPSAYRDRVVDVMEARFEVTLPMCGRTDYLTNRYSERSERAMEAIDRQPHKT